MYSYKVKVWVLVEGRVWDAVREQEGYLLDAERLSNAADKTSQAVQATRLDREELIMDEVWHA